MGTKDNIEIYQKNFTHYKDATNYMTALMAVVVPSKFQL